MSPASGSVEELPKPDFSHRAQHRTDGDLERDSLRAELGGVVELPDAMRGLMVELTRREARRHAYRPGNVPDRIAHAMHASDVLQTSPARRSGQHEIRVLRHPEEAEIDLAKKRPALQEERIPELLAERPEQPGQVEVLFDELRLHTFARGCLAAQVREQRAFRERRQAHAQASFSTTRHFVFKRPTRGSPWRIESTDFVDRTFS